MLFPEIDRLTLRAYCITQASLFSCLLLATSLSLLFKEKKIIFILLSINCVFHLLLDSFQTKWANGVHFFAPFSWDLFSVNLFWPEDIFSKVLTIAGGFLFFYFAIKEFHNRVSFSWPAIRTYLISGFLIICYFFLPLFLMDGPYKKNNHYIQTLKHNKIRKNQEIAIDRAPFDQKSNSITIFTGESFILKDKIPMKNAIISLQGIFIDNNSISVNVYHTHSPMRDIYSIIGILGTLILWLYAVLKKTKR
jgi:hypothetical protein